MIREPDASVWPTPQDIQLMSKHRIHSFKPQLRLEWRSQAVRAKRSNPIIPSAQAIP